MISIKAVKQYLNVFKYVLIELLFTFLLVHFFIAYLLGKYYIKYDVDNDIIQQISEVTGNNLNYPDADYVKFITDTGYDWSVTIYRNVKVIDDLNISFQDNEIERELASKFDKYDKYYYIIFGILISLNLLTFILLIRYCNKNL